MKKLATLFMAGALTLLVSGVALAQDETPGAKPGVAADEKPMAKPAEGGADAAAEPVAGDNWTAKGAALPKKGQMVLDVGVGWPELRASFHIGLLDRLTIVPRLTLFYGAADFRTVVGNTFGALLRFNVYSQDKLDIALEADVAFLLWYPVGNYYGSTNFGFQLGTPALAISYRVIPQLSILTGLNIPIAFKFTNGFCAFIPIQLRLGVEWHMPESNWHLYFTNDIGPDIVAASGASSVTVRWNALFGFGYKF
jgi:hypothetical protein